MGAQDNDGRLDDFEALDLPPADRLDVVVISRRGGVFEFIAKSVRLDCAIEPNACMVPDGPGRMRALGLPVSRKMANLAQLSDPEFIEELAEQLVSAQTGVHCMAEGTRIDFLVFQPGFVDKLMGAKEIGGEWLPRVRDAVEAAKQRRIEAYDLEDDPGDLTQGPA